MKVALYVHQFSQLGESSLDQFIQTMAGAVDELRPKLFQAQKNTGDWEWKNPRVWGIDNPAKYQELRKRLADARIACYGWCVPMGIDPKAESEMLAAYAQPYNDATIEWDVEPYADFWPSIADGSYTNVDAYLARVSKLGLKIRVDLPFRGAKEGSSEQKLLTRFVQMADPYVTEYWLQSYFGVAQANDAELALESLTARPIYHITDVAHLEPMYDWLQMRGKPQMGIWVAQQMTPKAYEFLRSKRRDDSPYLVGIGVQEALAREGDTAASNEAYAEGVYSITLGASGRKYVYVESENETFRSL